MAYPKKSDEDKYVRINVTMPPELQDRLIRYCQKEERTMSWCVQKALDEWLKTKGSKIPFSTSVYWYVLIRTIICFS